jgi:endonuclease-3
MRKQERAAEIYRRLDERYPKDLDTALEWNDPWELLIGTILAAQSTDTAVNRIMPQLLSRWPGPEEMAVAETSEIESAIRTVGLFRNKAKSLKGSAVMIAEDFGGEVPDSMEQLVRLPGVARKTANIVLWSAFGKNEGVAVDTHVKRLACRMGLTTEKDQGKIEKDLMKLYPQVQWGRLNHLLVYFGREVCTARKPDCPNCPLNDVCPKRGVEA